MKKSRFSESQISQALKEHEAGKKVQDICKELGISANTFYIWRKKYGGMDSAMLRKYKELERENTKLKQMYADLSLDHRILKDVVEKKL
ncbi:transposase [Croceimicrobium hydrocarbonivorans]|uniref:Transposase n=1 Tax=Croceimicrobium hydrocarbonivorans TaxID=2761580 RepID=A0A7H0VIW9_9FLAO|nr:transposase [Croceimicrobium hydrocarbonivorans]QNR22771.1 transposase [Croceimicrobium hydrocarbonivorans]QNR23659.1 transposase [Croceimicrobium hydrocarbonivorans]QNR23923.1 transposase [Croceimicrobium hydrocarbonivorans]QNR23972.1 transposase [Croceimicrobium hydrocarbonivorans]QNR24526.1 transposase [Croceimicrobium hydrocarbonivorans]